MPCIFLPCGFNLQASGLLMQLRASPGRRRQEMKVAALTPVGHPPWPTSRAARQSTGTVHRARPPAAKTNHSTQQLKADLGPSGLWVVSDFFDLLTDHRWMKGDRWDNWLWIRWVHCRKGEWLVFLLAGCSKSSIGWLSWQRRERKAEDENLIILISMQKILPKVSHLPD